MTNFPEDADPNNWHRYFAIEFNNRAWELAEKSSRTQEETLDMLAAAHAAALHWKVGGTDLNRMRARTLLAQTCALSGMGELALQLAEEVRSYFLSRDTECWELVLVYSVHANAAAKAGDTKKHAESYEAAQTALAGLSDDNEREIVIQTFRQVPCP